RRDLRAGCEHELADVALLAAVDRLAGGVDPGELEARPPREVNDRPGAAGRRGRLDAGAARRGLPDLPAAAQRAADVDRGRRALALPRDLQPGHLGEALGRDGLARLAIDDHGQARGWLVGPGDRGRERDPGDVLDALDGALGIGQRTAVGAPVE